MRAYIEAYGCTMNRGEAREIEEYLSSHGWLISDSPEGCDLVVLATCVVVQKTERKMLRRVKGLSDAKRLVVTGCIATLPTREEVLALAPEAEFCPPGDLAKLAAMVGDKVESASPVELADERASCAIVPIATGCLGHCSYCITRLARGELRSREPSYVVASVEKAVERSHPREIRLTCQDAAAYGRDLGTDLPSLIHSVCQIPSDFRLRIGMMNPGSALSLLDVLPEMYLEPKVFKFLHLPVQSGSDKVLGLMRRGYNVEDFRTVVRKVRNSIPDVSLSTDLIVGYPGEEDTDHESNLKLISEFRPDIVNVTRFSPRPGTAAAMAMHSVPGGIVKLRSREITRLRFKVALERNSEWVGTRTCALATEHGKRNTTFLRTDLYQQIVVPEVLPLGIYYSVDVTGATPTYLTGTKEGVA